MTKLLINSGLTTCSCARTIRYASVILVKMMHFNKLFFHMLTLKPLMKLNVTDH